MYFIITASKIAIHSIFLHNKLYMVVNKYILHNKLYMVVNKYIFFRCLPNLLFTHLCTQLMQRSRENLGIRYDATPLYTTKHYNYIYACTGIQ